MSDLCDCGCADPCPLGKKGSGYRCRLVDVASSFGCEIGEAASRLRGWRSSHASRGREEGGEMIIEIIGSRGEVLTSAVVDDPTKAVIFPPMTRAGYPAYIVADGEIIHDFADGWPGGPRPASPCGWNGCRNPVDGIWRVTDSFGRIHEKTACSDCAAWWRDHRPGCELVARFPDDRRTLDQ